MESHSSYILPKLVNQVCSSVLDALTLCLEERITFVYKQEIKDIVAVLVCYLYPANGDTLCFC